MKVSLEIDEQTLRNLITNHIADVLGPSIDPKLVKIEVKRNRLQSNLDRDVEDIPQQNYRSEWETAAFRARIDTEVA